MKIIIIHASAGQGHKRAAEAIFNCIKENSSHDAAIIDSLDYTNFLFKFFYIKGYAFLVAHFPAVWGFFYRLTDSPRNSFINSFFRFFNKNLNSSRLRCHLRKENPDVIISTHFFANEVVSYLKKENLIKSRTISVITDFLSHYYWIAPGIDLYVVACKETKGFLLSQGIPEEKIRVLGIPVDVIFFLELKREGVCKKLNLNPDKFSVLVATGSFGFEIIETLVKLLKGEVQLLIICGNNKKLLQRLNGYKEENLKVFGFVKNMHELMSAADVIITKPGGLTISEALVKNLPMIFISPIPGQETNNADFFVQRRLGLRVENISQIKEIISNFKNNSDYLEQFKMRLAEFPKVNAAKEIVNLI